MELLHDGFRGSFLPAFFIILLLCVSSGVAAPVRLAAASAQSGQNTTQVVPTVLSGYKSTGALPSSTLVDVAVGIPLQNYQSLQYLEQQISTPGSPQFRHFLTPAQVQSFLPTTEFNSALAYLQQGGLKVVMTGLDSMIVVQGTEAQVSKYLGLSYEVYSNGVYTYYTASGVSPIPGAYLYSTNFTSAILAHPTDLAAENSSSLYSTHPSQSNQTVASGAYALPDLESVYNATGLYSKGDFGTGFTAGILDYEGDPYIAGQLQYFNSLYGLPSSPFKVIPIGAYNPSLGVYTGWSTEISLDVESVHSMAPGAAIDLYIANNALPLGATISSIVQQGAVSDLSQSFGIGPESTISSTGASSLEMNVILTDEYYLLGSAEGMTFLASSGDVGGSGYAGGPEGTLSYPTTSPYVTSVGGTTTYLTFAGSTVSSFYQTAWSNYGFVPDGVNYGGGGGGVSILEPRPWYQSGLTSPSGFVNGREAPDLSLNANGIPGVTIVIPGNYTTVEGGTSESSPLLAGLLTLIMGSERSELGLVNPTLYSLGASPSYSKVYYPITFGYTIPWVSTTGYNMATGWGAPNIGEMAGQFGKTGAQSLGVDVSATVGGIVEEDVLAGQALIISANVTGSHPVTTGSFTATLETLSGAVGTSPLSYSALTKSWVGQLVVPATSSGISYLTVSGSSGGVSGTGFAELFTGYVATFVAPSADTPYSGQFGISVELNITTLGGVPATGVFSVAGLSYSIKSNTYNAFSGQATPLLPSFVKGFFSGSMDGVYPSGPAILTVQGGAYGYLPFMSGVDLQSSYIETTVLSEPGAVAPGQTIFIIASLEAPINMPYVQSQETGLPVSFSVDYGSNVTVYLVNHAGKTVASTPLYFNSYLSSLASIQGAMTVPQGLAPGLYNVILNSSFNSFDLSTQIDGSYFGQVYVAPAVTPFVVSFNDTAPYQGQTVTVNAKIDYANGTSVKYGVYTGAIYPKDLQNSYSLFTELLPFDLTYDSLTGYWTANLTLPSSYNAGGSVLIDQGALYLSGAYDVFVTGVSADGVPTNTDISNQAELQLQPYLYLAGTALTSLPQTSQVAFVGDTLVGAPISPARSVSPQVLTGDLFIGSNTFQGGTLVITQSQIQGTLSVKQANVTLVGVTGGNIVATGSHITIRDSSLQSVTLTNSVVSAESSTLGKVTPSLPTIAFQQPVSGAIFNGTTGSVSVTGQNVASVSIFLDGSLVQNSTGSSTVSFPLDAGSLSVGVHEITVVAEQQDGMSSSGSLYFSADAALVAANNTISAVSTSLGSVSTSLSSVSTSLGSVNSSVNVLSGQVSSEKSTISSLSSELNTANETIYALALVAVLALIIAIVAVARKPRSPNASAPTDQSPPAPDPTAPESPAPMPESDL